MENNSTCNDICNTCMNLLIVSIPIQNLAWNHCINNTTQCLVQHARQEKGLSRNALCRARRVEE